MIHQLNDISLSIDDVLIIEVIWRFEEQPMIYFYNPMFLIYFSMLMSNDVDAISELLLDRIQLKNSLYDPKRTNEI